MTNSTSTHKYPTSYPEDVECVPVPVESLDRLRRITGTIRGSGKADVMSARMTAADRPSIGTILDALELALEANGALVDRLMADQEAHEALRRDVNAMRRVLGVEA